MAKAQYSVTSTKLKPDDCILTINIIFLMHSTLSFLAKCQTDGNRISLRLRKFIFIYFLKVLKSVGLVLKFITIREGINLLHFMITMKQLRENVHL